MELSRFIIFSLTLMALICDLVVDAAAVCPVDKRDYHEVLGIQRTASNRELKNACRKLVVKTHPDKNKEKWAREKFIQYLDTFEFLSCGKKIMHPRPPKTKDNYDFDQEKWKFGFLGGYPDEDTLEEWSDRDDDFWSGMWNDMRDDPYKHGYGFDGLGFFKTQFYNLYKDFDFPEFCRRNFYPGSGGPGFFAKIKDFFNNLSTWVRSFCETRFGVDGDENDDHDRNWKGCK